MKNPSLIFAGPFFFAKGFLLLCGKVFSQMWRRPFYYRLIIQNMYDFGYRSLFIIFLFGIVLGVVLTLHIGLSLEKYGAKFYVPKVIILSLMGEVATVIAVFILAGKIGAGITSEIASMKVSEQLDAMRALAVSPLKRVVIPKVIACLVIIPVLCLLLHLIGFLTSAYVAKTHLHLDPVAFLARGLYTPELRFFVFGIFKTLIFALFISITSCYYGLNITKGSYEIGRATMRAVVVSFILIIFGDFLLTKLYYDFLA